MINAASRRIVFPSGEELIEASLYCKSLAPTKSHARVCSFSDESITYDVSLEEQTCTCPDFAKRFDQPINHFSRWCKHLIRELYHQDAFRNEPDWLQAIGREGARGPIGAYFLRCKDIPEVLLTANAESDWINVFSRPRRKVSGVFLNCGPINCFD